MKSSVRGAFLFEVCRKFLFYRFEFLMVHRLYPLPTKYLSASNAAMHPIPAAVTA